MTGKDTAEITVGRPPSTFEKRLAALDRAINYAHNCTFGTQMSGDEVLRLASQFEQHLIRSDGQ